MNSVIREFGAIMGVWAHPDDETFCMAGILAVAAKNGQKVVCITATRGEAGVQDESKWPLAELARIRTREQQQALKILGIETCHILDYPDGACHKVDVKSAVNRIVSYIKKYQPSSIFTFGPDGLTGHTDHQTVSSWTTLAVEKSRSKATIYHTVQTEEQYEHMLVADKQLNVYFNIDKPPVMKDCDCDICFTLPKDIYELKVAALRAMPSQTEVMLNGYDHVLPKALGVEAFRKYTPDLQTTDMQEV